MKDAVIVAAVRTPTGKANKGTLRNERPDTLGGHVIKALLERAEGLDPADVDDVLMGCAFPEAEQGLNIARQCAVMGGLPVSVPAATINRFCSSGLQTVAQAAQSIMTGQTDVAIAGGVECMSQVPMGGYTVHPNPQLVEEYPEMYISMGLTAENVAEKYDVSREDQDEFAYHSHRKAIEAWEEGRFEDQIVPVEVTQKMVTPDGEVHKEQVQFKQDEGPRKDTSVEALGNLRAVFKQGGTVTAGNSSQMNDAASALLIMSADKAESLGLKPMARFVSFASAGVAPEIMGIGPIEAVPKALKLAGLEQDDIDLIELNEAFAAQSLAVIRELGLDADRVNVNGGAIAMGHPLGCTGAKLTTQILYEMKHRNAKYGMVTMCVGGGMGAAGIFENLS